MENILKKLLDDLARVAEGGDKEIFDTDVREQMFDAVWSGFIKPQENYQLPDTFGMFSDNANAAIKKALGDFVRDAAQYAAENKLTIHERLNSFQNEKVTGGKEEFTHDDFFGYLEDIDRFVD